jgi:hypothetical protein
MNEANYIKNFSTGNRLDIIKGLENYSRQKRFVPAGIICRAGIGAISECLSAKSLPILLSDTDIEIQYNRRTLLNLGLALDIKNLKNLGYEELLEIENIASGLEWPEILSAQDFTKQLLEEN